MTEDLTWWITGFSAGLTYSVSSYCESVGLLSGALLRLLMHTGTVRRLPYRSTIAVWSHRLSLVESNVLDLVQWVMQTPVTSCRDLLENIKYLVRLTVLRFYLFIADYSEASFCISIASSVHTMPDFCGLSGSFLSYLLTHAGSAKWNMRYDEQKEFSLDELDIWSQGRIQ
jgi:hypothetical protein